MQHSDFQLALTAYPRLAALTQDELKCDIAVYFIVIVVQARDILACFAKSLESNRAFYEFMIYRNVQ